jgi:hypothetical protein
MGQTGWKKWSLVAAEIIGSFTPCCRGSEFSIIGDDYCDKMGQWRSAEFIGICIWVRIIASTQKTEHHQSGPPGKTRKVNFSLSFLLIRREVHHEKGFCRKTDFDFACHHYHHGSSS